LSDAHSIKMGAIRETFKRAIAFVQVFDKGSEKPVTREDILRFQRWDRKALCAENLKVRREDAAADAAEDSKDY
jgi:hypothetical protein